MAKAKKLPSGTWRCQVFDYTDQDGKKHRISFTGPTRAIAEAKAAAYMESKDRKGHSVNITVAKALDDYIRLKEGVLSPSTIANYIRIQQRYFGDIGQRKIYSLTNTDMQLFVSDLNLQNLSPKTIRNIYGLLISAINMVMPEAVYRVTMPRKQKIDYSVPDRNDIDRLMECAPEGLKLAIILGAYGMRRGEICAVKYADVNYAAASIYVHADMVIGKDYKYQLKPSPKTSHSIRMVPVSREVIDLIGTGDPEEFIFPHSPDYITKHFIKLRDSLGLKCRFHDLRHYYASSLAEVVPRAYIEEFGGWSPGSKALSTAYTNTIDSRKEGYRRKAVQQISAKSAHESAHGLQKSG